MIQVVVEMCCFVDDGARPVPRGVLGMAPALFLICYVVLALTCPAFASLPSLTSLSKYLS